MRRNNLSYLRNRSGKSARLTSKDFDRNAVNDTTVAEEPAETPTETPAETPAEAPTETPTKEPTTSETKEEKEA